MKKRLLMLLTVMALLSFPLLLTGCTGNSSGGGANDVPLRLVITSLSLVTATVFRQN